MERTRWQQLSQALDDLLDLDPDARASRLDALEAEDPDFARDLRGLLAQEDTQDSLLDVPLVTAPPGPREGEQVGPYRLERLLGEGGMGQVWVAERADGLYERRVALKLLRPGLADPNLRLRFTRERQILARLEHPHIARLLDAGIDASGQPYLALEEVQGEGILEYCRKRGLGLRPRLQLFRQVCEAVSHAHGNLVVHRDLKPSNILVTPDGQVRLLDFGIAKLLDGNASDPPEATRTGVRSFTLHYAAPEQIRGEPVTTQTDVYSLGVVLYELLSGQKPYRLKRETSAQWEEAILAGEPQRPSTAVLRGGDDEAVPGIDRRRWSKMLAGDLDNIVLKSLSKRPAGRYPSAEALSLDVQRHLDGMPVLARPQSVGYRLRKFLRRHRWPIGLSLVAALVLVVLLGFTWRQRQEAVREAARAQALQDFVIGLFEHAGVARSGRPLEVETLVDAGERRGDRELSMQPRAHAELLGVIARIRIALGQYDEAGRLLDRQLGVLSTLADVSPGLRLDSATQRGRVQRLQGDAQACVATLSPFQGTARQVQAQLPASVSEYYSQLARCRRAVGEYEAARALFERSLALRRSALGDDVGVVENLTDLAALSVDAHDPVQALRRFEGALAQLEQIAGPRHRLAVDILRSIGATQLQLGQPAAARRSYLRALQVSSTVQGASHPASLALRRQAALLLLDEGRLALAERLLASNHALVLPRFGASSAEAAGSWDALGQVAHAMGDLDRAHARYLRASTAWRALDNRPMLADVLQRDAMVLLEANRPHAAQRALEQSLRSRARDTPDGHLLLAEAAWRMGQVDRAETEIAKAEAAAPQAAEPELARARLLLARGAGEAETSDMAVRMQALADRPVRNPQSLRVHQQARLLAAALTCDSAAFEAIDARLAADAPEGGPFVRESKRLRKACAGRTKPAEVRAEAAPAAARSRPRPASPA